MLIGQLELAADETGDCLLLAPGAEICDCPAAPGGPGRGSGGALRGGRARNGFGAGRSFLWPGVVPGGLGATDWAVGGNWTAHTHTTVKGGSGLPARGRRRCRRPRNRRQERRLHRDGGRLTGACFLSIFGYRQAPAKVMETYDCRR